jgi:hypothetical protein
MRLAWLATAAGRLAYRRGEIGLLALLAASLAGGLLVERWRARSPETLAWLEAEPPRLRAARARAAAPAAAQAPARRQRRVVPPEPP